MSHIGFKTAMRYEEYSSLTFSQSLHQAAEDYLALGSQRVIILTGQVNPGMELLKKAPIDSPSSFLISACKVISYFTLVLPLAALIVKAYFRSTHTYCYYPSRASTILQYELNLQPFVLSTANFSLENEDQRLVFRDWLNEFPTTIVGSCLSLEDEYTHDKLAACFLQIFTLINKLSDDSFRDFKVTLKTQILVNLLNKFFVPDLQKNGTDRQLLIQALGMSIVDAFRPGADFDLIRQQLETTVMIY